MLVILARFGSMLPLMGIPLKQADVVATGQTDIRPRAAYWLMGNKRVEPQRETAIDTLSQSERTLRSMSQALRPSTPITAA